MTFYRKLTFISILFIATGVVVAVGVFKRSLYKLVSDFQHPFTVPESSAKTLMGNKSLTLKDKSELIEEILRLRRSNERLSANLALAKELTREKEALEKLMKLPPQPGFTPIFARIVIRDPIFWNVRFSIDKGTSSGIAIGDVALACVAGLPRKSGVDMNFAVVGRVISVSTHRACIETIASRACRISAIIVDTRAAGITEGATIKESKPMIRLAYLPAFRKYKAGTPVLTSGLATPGSEGVPAIPAGLLIGTLAPRPGSVNAATVVDNLTAEAKIIPAIDLDSLTLIAVMTRPPPRQKTVK